MSIRNIERTKWRSHVRGRRVQKIAPDGTHTFLCDGWRPVVETVARASGGTDRIEYFWGKDLSDSLDGAAGVGGLLYVKRNGAIYVPFGDAFGNVMGYWDENGTVVAEYAYDAFGRTVAKSGTMADVFSIRYSTKYYDAETGMYYYGKRFYLTMLCRWLTRDPIEEQGGANLYGFCGNCAACLVDLEGLIPVAVETRRKNNFIQRLANGGDKFSYVPVNGVGDIEVGSLVSRSKLGLFVPTLTFEDCSLVVLLQIYIRDNLAKKGNKGTIYFYTPHSNHKF